jgi:hypothetical protein
MEKGHTIPKKLLEKLYTIGFNITSTAKERLRGGKVQSQGRRIVE